VPCEAAEEFGVFGDAADVNLKEGKAFLERGELLKELFLSELLFCETAIVFVVSVDKIFHDDAPLRIASLRVSTSGEGGFGGQRQAADPHSSLPSRSSVPTAWTNRSADAAICTSTGGRGSMIGLPGDMTKIPASDRRPVWTHYPTS
jgi:hypothetical protein